MAQQWAAKAPTEIVEREWAVPADDSVASFTVSASGVTVDASERSGDVITVTLSGGTLAETATVSFAATTTNGLVLTQVFYLPIRTAENALSETARDICIAALRKVTGVAETPDSAELDDALERLSDMLAGWAAEGADLGIKLPCAANDIIYAPDWAIGAIKANLTARVFDLYGEQMPMTVALDAQRGLQRLKMRLLPADRDGADYY